MSVSGSQSGHSRTAARQWREWQMLGTVDVAGVVTAGASVHSSASVTRSSGSSRTACWGHRNRSRQSVASPRAAWRVIRNVVASPHRRGHGSFGYSGHKSVRGARPERFTSHRSGIVTVGRHHAPLGGSFVRRRPLERLSLEGSFEGWPNTQMEPTRPTVLCDPVAAARGSFATLGGRSPPP